MIKIETQQQYIDQLYRLQCCIGDFSACILSKRQIGKNTSELDSRFMRLNVYYETLLRQDIVEEYCLTKEETLSLLEKARNLCKQCISSVNTP